MKKITKISLLILLSFGLSFGKIINASSSLNEDTKNLKVKLCNLQQITAHFSQTVMGRGKQLSKSTGNMAIKRPGRFRWETTNPLKQLVIADGSKLWVYDVELEQVSVKRQSGGLEGTAALFLSANCQNISNDFIISAKTIGSKELYDLHSKLNKSSFQRVKLIFTHNELTTLELFDQLGQQTIVKFSNIKSNSTISDKIFKFKPPHGVDVIYN